MSLIEQHIDIINEIARRLVERANDLAKEVAAQKDLIENMRRGWDKETARLNWALKQGIKHPTFIEGRESIDKAIKDAIEDTLDEASSLFDGITDPDEIPEDMKAIIRKFDSKYPTLATPEEKRALVDAGFATMPGDGTILTDDAYQWLLSTYKL